MKYLSLFLLIALVSGGGNRNNGGNKNKNKGGNHGGNEHGGCVDSCDKQSECLNTEITEISENRYEICVWWDSSLSNCRKGSMDSISHVCYGGEEKQKKEGCNSGETICREVDCEDYASFGLKDGSECAPNEDGTTQKAYAFSEVEGIICRAGTEGGMCGGGAKKDCAWYIPAPKCEDTTTTTTQTPENTGTTGTNTDTTNVPGTTSDDDTTTTEGPCIRETDEGDECLNHRGLNVNEASCDGLFEADADGCAWVDGSCTRKCGYYSSAKNTGGLECSEQCGCKAVAEVCMEEEFVEGASSAGMRIDEYVIESEEYDAIDANDGNEGSELIKGVDNMYLFIGGGVIALLLIVIVGFIVCKLVMKKKKYVEMEEEQEIQMNEIEVDGGQTMVSTR